MGNKQFMNMRLGARPAKARGFTLVELIAVVAIISMIAVYITISINQSSDDAKVGIATAFLASNVPAAISSYRARNMASCRSMAIAPNTPGDIKALLTDRGLVPNSPWDDPWTASYSDANRQISLVFTVSGANANASATNIAANLSDVDVPQVVNATAASNVITVVYSCS
ncbi:MAG: type II secretion system protein [Pseudomonadota bacterium]|nr:type II secretion system protein [Pseudomonadota bacterium]